MAKGGRNDKFPKGHVVKGKGRADAPGQVKKGRSKKQTATMGKRAVGKAKGKC